MNKKIKIDNEINEEYGENFSSSEENKDEDFIKLKESLKEKTEEAETYLNHLQRLQAEFENYKKRTNSEKAGLKEFGKECFIKELLPIVDNMEKALTHSENDSNDKNIIRGVELVYKQLKEILKKEGISKIDSLGKKFDPLLHEAVAAEISDKHESGIILGEIESGYFFNGRLLKPAKVKVSVSKEL